jgi:DNA-binding NarL/FixJ family response regulator
MAPESAATVLLVEDFDGWRYQERELLRTHLEWKIVSEACAGAEGVRKAAELHPDIILLDIGLPKLNGIEAARRIRQSSPQAHIVFVTQDGDKDIRDAALSIKGARYVLKSNAAAELVPAIAAALADHYAATL